MIGVCEQDPMYFRTIKCDPAERAFISNEHNTGIRGVAPRDEHNGEASFFFQARESFANLKVQVRDIGIWG